MIKKLLKDYSKASLITLDEWLFQPLTDLHARYLLEIINSTYDKGSIIFCSQFALGGWHEKLGDDTAADAILDRSIHNSYEIFIDAKYPWEKGKEFNNKIPGYDGSICTDNLAHLSA